MGLKTPPQTNCFLFSRFNTDIYRINKLGEIYVFNNSSIVTFKIDVQVIVRREKQILVVSIQFPSVFLSFTNIMTFVTLSRIKSSLFLCMFQRNIHTFFFLFCFKSSMRTAFQPGSLPPHRQQ